MAFPAAWPPRVASGIRSIRFYGSGTSTANFADNAFLFINGAGANTFSPVPAVTGGATADPLTPAGTGTLTTQPIVHPMIWANTIRVCNDGANTLEFSFDGTNVHGVLLKGEQVSYRNRFEAGIAFRYPAGGAASAFRVEAW